MLIERFVEVRVKSGFEPSPRFDGVQSPLAVGP